MTRAHLHLFPIISPALSVRIGQVPSTTETSINNGLKKVPNQQSNTVFSGFRLLERVVDCQRLVHRLLRCAWRSRPPPSLHEEGFCILLPP